MRSLSWSMTKKLLRSAGDVLPAASGDLLQRGGTCDGRGKLAAVLWSGLRRIAGSKAIQHFAKALFGQVFVSILPDQHHRRVDTGAEALDLFPAKIAVLGQVEGIVMDAALADLDEVAGAAQPAWRRTAHLHVGFLADRRELEHRVEGRDLQHTDVGHLQEIGDRADRRLRNPTLMLLLDPPQDRDGGRRLAPGRIFRDFLPGPGEVFVRER